MELLGYADAQRMMASPEIARQLVVVSRQHADLYVYLRDRFAPGSEVAVEIILDRRLSERRRERREVEVERRRVDRRARLDVDAQLRERSHVVIALAGDGRDR